MCLTKDFDTVSVYLENEGFAGLCLNALVLLLFHENMCLTN
jgi:hypothetical protein